MARANRIFVWEGIDRTGKKTSGEITGTSLNLTRIRLRRQGIHPTRVTGPGWISGFASGRLGERISSADIALFTRQVATMIKAGVPLVQSFEIVATGTENQKMKRVIQKLKDEVASGHSFAYAVRRQPKYFDDLFCCLIDVGEQAGTLDTLLGQLARYREMAEALRAKFKSALSYPATVLVVASLVSAILLVKVVPQFEQIFAGFGAELPALTQVVVKMSDFMQAWWIEIIATATLGWFLGKAIYQNSRFLQKSQERLALRLPIIGKLLNRFCLARFARTLATTFAAGVPLVDALRSIAGATGNIVYYQAIQLMIDDVSSGIPLNTSMKSARVFPPMMIQMVAVGEESGTLDEMLDRVATYYEDLVENSVARLTSLMEPMIVLILGLVVGVLLISMYLPVFSMGQAISGGY